MFINTKCHPTVLSQDEYWSPDKFLIEQSSIKSNCWLWACLRSDVADENDAISKHLCEVPVVIWNTSGKIRAFINICLHRNSKILPNGRHNTPTLKCQYHGWKYDNQGKLAYIPEKKCFDGICLEKDNLTELRVETLGNFIFISFNENTQSLRMLLGNLSEEIDRHFLDWNLFKKDSRDINVNWKIILENALESYHVPIVHPLSFKTFRPEKWHDHQVGKIYSRFHDLKPWGNSLLSKIYKSAAYFILGKKTLSRMTHVHIFPNMLFYYGDLFSILYFIEPIQPEKSKLNTFFYLPSKVRWPIFTKPLQIMMQPFLKFIFFRILKEDLRILKDVQHGLKNATVFGVLSSREERILAFQKFLKKIKT